MGRDGSRSRERRGDRDRDEKGRGSDKRDNRGDDRRDDRRDDRGSDRRDDRGDDRPRSRSGERRRDRSGERAPASGREDKGRDRPSKKEEPEEKDDDEYRVGRQVMVKGLQKNPEKNGSIGQLVEFNKEKGRWVVANSGGNNNFKEENLELMADNSDIINENEEPPTAKVYITKLSAEVTEKDLQVLFGGCGLIEKEQPKSGPKGFRDQWPLAVKLYKPGRDGGDACVTYMDAQSAKAAIKSFHRYKFKGSKIAVAYAGQGKTYEKKESSELQKPWYLREENQGKLDREGGGGGKDGGKSAPKPGDWTCEGCGASVFASKDSCFKCGGAKPGGGGGSTGGKDGGKGGDKGGKKGDKEGGKGGRW